MSHKLTIEIDGSSDAFRRWGGTSHMSEFFEILNDFVEGLKRSIEVSYPDKK